MVKTKLNSSSGRRRFSFDIMMIPYIVIVVALLAVGGELWAIKHRSAKAIVENTYQAVFLTNGQVYFGKLSPLNRGYMALADVYYLQESTATEEDPTSKNGTNKNIDTNTATTDTQFKIIRLGEEIHQPQNGMIISQDQILYWENLSMDSRIINAIAEAKK